MDSKQEIELTIRTALLIKSLSELIGRRDALTIRLVVDDAIEKLGELAKFTKTLR